MYCGRPAVQPGREELSRPEGGVVHGIRRVMIVFLSGLKRRVIH